MAEPETNNSGSGTQKNTEANPKVVVGVLVVIGLAALILGFVHVLNTISSPFSLNRGLSNTPTSLAEDERLKGQDTDSDGLNDYDEAVLYGTSPFLSDSDGDDIDDRAETLAGSDPNCPEGVQCGLAVGNVNTNGSVASNTNSAIGFGGDITMDQLRQTLINAGAPAYIINNTDDATLLALYQKALASDSGNTNATVNDAQLIEGLNKLTPSEIRQFLASGGVDPNVLAQVDDAELTDFFQRAVEEQLVTQP